jgi:hypothetical protein
MLQEDRVSLASQAELVRILAGLHGPVDGGRRLREPERVGSLQLPRYVPTIRPTRQERYDRRTRLAEAVTARPPRPHPPGARYEFGRMQSGRNQ